MRLELGAKIILLKGLEILDQVIIWHDLEAIGAVVLPELIPADPSPTHLMLCEEVDWAELGIKRVIDLIELNQVYMLVIAEVKRGKTVLIEGYRLPEIG